MNQIPPVLFVTDKRNFCPFAVGLTLALSEQNVRVTSPIQCNDVQYHYPLSRDISVAFNPL